LDECHCCLSGGKKLGVALVAKKSGVITQEKKIFQPNHFSPVLEFLNNL
jgi:hypothetical protein